MTTINTENCKPDAGKLMPVVDFNKCEAKGPCVPICPYHVLELHKISDKDFSSLSFFGKIKTKAHGREKAFVVKADQCHACGLCVTACPEKAIKLTKYSLV